MEDRLGVHLIVIGLVLLIWFFAGIICLWVASLMNFRGDRKPGWVAGIVFVGPLVLFMLLALIGWWNSPMKLSRDEVPGKYEIDRSFYSGKEADWQHATYRMELTDKELILRDARTDTIWRYPIKWGWAGRWSFENEEVKHHLVRSGPTLYRRKFSYYYVFDSPLYGNVFFRRESAVWFWAVSGGAFALFALFGLWVWWCFNDSGA